MGWGLRGMGVGGLVGGWGRGGYLDETRKIEAEVGWWMEYRIWVVDSMHLRAVKWTGVEEWENPLMVSLRASRSSLEPLDWVIVCRIYQTDLSLKPSFPIFRFMNSKSSQAQTISFTVVMQ